MSLRLKYPRKTSAFGRAGSILTTPDGGRVAVDELPDAARLLGRALAEQPRQVHVPGRLHEIPPSGCPWKRCRQQGNRLFFFRVALAVASFLATAVIAGISLLLRLADLARPVSGGDVVMQGGRTFGSRVFYRWSAFSSDTVLTCSLG